MIIGLLTVLLLAGAPGDSTAAKARFTAANHDYAKGDFAAALGHRLEALAHFRLAQKLAVLPAERDFIGRRINEVEKANQAAAEK